MKIGSINTGAAPSAAEAAAGARAAPADRPNYPLWASFLTDIVAATRRYRHAVPPVRGWLLVARLPPRLSGSELRYRRANSYRQQT